MAQRKYVGEIDADQQRLVTLGELALVKTTAENAESQAAVKPDFDAAETDAAGILNKPDVATLQAKLDTIESGATADQSGAEIVTLVDAVPNTNLLTDAERTKLAGLEEGKFKGRFTAVDFTTALSDLTTANPAPPSGSTAEISDGSTVKTAVWDGTAWVEDNAATTGETAATIKTKYESNPNTNAFTDTLLNKLNGVEASATADQTPAEITAAIGAASDANLLTDAEKAALSNRASVTAIPGDNATTSFTITHGYNDAVVSLSLYEVATSEYVGIKIARAPNATTAVVGPFAVAPAAGAYELHALRG